MIEVTSVAFILAVVVLALRPVIKWVRNKDR